MTQSSTSLSENGHLVGPDVDPEVVPKAKRRTFTAAYKQRILEEADGCNKRGQIGALLRREGLYSSHLSNWRRERETNGLRGSTEYHRGRKPQQSAAEKESARLRRENERLRKQLEQANLIISAQKKLAQALEQTLDQKDENSR
jgi:transposase